MKSDRSINLTIGLIRWVAVAVIIRLAFLSPQHDDLFLQRLAIVALTYNLIITFPGKTVRYRMTSVVTVLLDAVFIGVFSFISPFHSHYWIFIFLLPVLYLGTYYGTEGGLIAALFVSVSHGIVIFFSDNLRFVSTFDQVLPKMGPIIGFFGLYLFFGLVVGKFSLRVKAEKQAKSKMDYVTEQLGATVRFLGVSGDKAQKSAKQMTDAINLIGTTAFSGVSMNLNMNSILEEMIKGAVEVVKAERGMIMLANPNTQTLKLEVCCGLFCEKFPKNVAYGEDAPGWVADNGKSLIITKNNYPKQLSAFIEARDVHDCLVSPIIIDDEVVGVLSMENKKDGTFNSEDMKVIDTIAGEIAMVIVNTTLYEEILEKRNSLEKMIKEVQLAQEKERRRIARDLHDGIAQSLAKLSLDLGISKKKTIQKKESTAEIEEYESQVKELIIETRRLIYNLRPAGLDDYGLVPTLEQFVKKYSEETKINIKLKTDINARLPEEYEIHLFRIVQEGLNNIKKYAMVGEASVSIKSTKKGIVLFIKDKGMGFDPTKIDLINAHDDNFGLLGIKERVESLSGIFEIESSPGKGTVISAKWPSVVEEELSV